MKFFHRISRFFLHRITRSYRNILALRITHGFSRIFGLWPMVSARNLRDQNLPQKSVYIREICGTYSTPKGYLQRPNRSPPHKSVSNKYLFLRESLYFRFPFSFLFCKSCFSEESSFSRYSSSVISSSNISSSFVTSSSAISSSSVISFSFFPKSGSILR